MPFKPEAERAKWRVALDLFDSLPDGTLVTYAELAYALGYEQIPDQESRRGLWGAAGRAGRVLRTKGRTVTTVRGQGYRVEAVSASSTPEALAASLEAFQTSLVYTLKALAAVLELLPAYFGSDDEPTDEEAEGT